VDKRVARVIAEHVVGLRPTIKIEGPASTIASLSEAVSASRELFVALGVGDIERIESAVARKTKAVTRWESLTGGTWVV